MKRRFIAMLMSLVLMIGIMPAAALAAEIVDSGKCGDNLTWTLDEDGVLTISGEGDMWDFNEYDNLAEWSYSRVFRIVVEEGVTSIGDYAFEGCLSIEDVFVPASVKEIGDKAFAGLSQIYNGIWVDEANHNYCSDENGVVYNKDKTELICVPQSVYNIFTIPASVKRIADYAFLPEWEISFLVFEGDAPEFGELAFRYLEATIFYPENNNTWTKKVMQDYGGVVVWKSHAPNEPIPLDVIASGKCGDNLTWKLDEIGVLTISGSGNMWNIGTYEDSQVSWNDCGDMIDTIVIEEGITSVGDSAFQNLWFVKKISIANTVSKIGYEALSYMGGLKKVDIPASVTQIYDGNFVECPSLTGIWVDEDNPNYSSDENGALFDKYKIELIKVPSAIEGTYIVPDGVIHIRHSAFMLCHITEVIIPASVTNIDCYFEYCIQLDAITVDADNPNYSSDENGALYNKNMTTLLIVPRGIEGQYKIREGVITVAYWAINGFDGITDLVIPASVEKIEDYAIVNSHALRKINVNEDNKYYSNDSNGVLYNKNKTELLYVPSGMNETLVVPASVTKIDYRAFDDSNYYLNVKFLGDAPDFYGYLWYENTIYYPVNNPTWTEEVRARFGENITWIPYTPSDRLQGDVDGNGEVSNADLIMVARYIVELYDENTIADIEAYGDMNGDGIVTNIDLITMARTIVGLE